MNREAPDKLLLQWLGGIPVWQREALASHYIFMTSSDSGDFAFNGDEAWCHFEARLNRPEFPLRRVARLLTVRSLFTFLLEFSDPGTFPVPHPNGAGDEFYPFDSAQFLRSCNRWSDLCQTGLSDKALQEWLLSLQG
ncbi:MAG: hypothetical protein U9R69_05945 [Thermodesulfobacteriota bacterium]|nr:hypothetical protein [Thermodesulfobacteriota bacterium]